VRIAIIIPARNAAPWIGDAIRSVLAQSHPDWTLLIIDDGSTDATAAIAAGYSDPRIRVLRQPNGGVSAARNRGIAVAAQASDALLFLDADDWLAPDALSRLADALAASPGAVAAVGAYTFVGTRRVRRPPSGDILERLLVRNLFANGGHLLIRRAVVQAVGGFLPGLSYGEDWQYWIRIALRGPFAAVPGARPVLFVRQHPGGAYQIRASDPCAFSPCMAAIFCNPTLAARIGRQRLAAIRRRTDAENHWVIGRELIRHGRHAEGRDWLRRSVDAAPSLKRVVLLAAAWLAPLLPPPLRGPFRPYRTLTATPEAAPPACRTATGGPEHAPRRASDC
jgi:glycosyltransferase involved in cell wall biosynthesis